MTKQITLEKALKLVEFAKTTSGEWQIKNIYGDVYGDVWGDVHGDETPKEKLPAADWQLVQLFERLVEEGATKEELLLAIDQLEDN
jgi:hypothetical protein